jgi:hypothetical protein
MNCWKIGPFTLGQYFHVQREALQTEKSLQKKLFLSFEETSFPYGEKIIKKSSCERSGKKRKQKKERTLLTSII